MNRSLRTTLNQQWKSLQCSETLTACLPQTAPCRRPCLSMWFVDADSPGMYRQVGPQPVPQLVKQFCSRGTVVGYHAQMTKSGRAQTRIAAYGGTLSTCGQGAPCHSSYFNLAWPPFFAFAGMQPLAAWRPCPGVVTPISGIQCLRPMRPTSCISMVLPGTKACSSSK